MRYDWKLTMGKRKDRRVKRTISFHLYINEDRELEVYDELMDRKEGELMRPSIRDALLLFFTLCTGNTYWLEKWFPHIIEKFREQGRYEERESQAVLAERITGLLEHYRGQLPEPTAHANGNGNGHHNDLGALPSAFVEEAEPDVSAKEVRQNFGASMAGMFDEDEDEDFWDD